ncbi:soluble lytic murein transglycosylase-like protein [Hephaestia caeni]|uniref:Soluble lytic murein transglycosylase-like protein n=2 Tax=Hephaestia caeni TaxID=645617 RepID=A0A397PF85_9SPHN|nr:lytic transglycosylase domain-containing protein [Hephaestia caeni]RIA45895.1 soluble lytic murein transglycosylase-like protein [Hephaestia caeni]
MMRGWLLVCAFAAFSAPALAAPADTAVDTRVPRVGADRGAAIPAQLDARQREGYRAVFAAIRDKRWTDAQLGLDLMKPGPLHAIARAELYTAAGSPKVALDPLLALLREAPELPQAAQLSRLAALRGATDADLPPLPEVHDLRWIAGAPSRRRAKGISDAASAALAVEMRPFIKADDGASAEALLGQTQGLTPEATTEWRQRVAWMYYLESDDTNARRVAATAAGDPGEWGVQAHWVTGLAAWRQRDCAVAGTSFEAVATRAGDSDMRAAGAYWASRADMACGRPDKVQGHLQTAAQYDETFYGQLARQALGIDAPMFRPVNVSADWAQLEHRPNAQVAAALVEIGENRLADEVIRHQAEIGAASDYAALIHVTAAMNLPSTQLWLAHNAPAGATAVASARFPAPDWVPDGGWRVDKALVYAHTLQESRFRTDVVSPAGAYGLMQIMPAAAIDIGRAHGRVIDRADLTRPSTNIEVGQSYLEQLRDQACTGGLLPKVIAAYNAGPVPVSAWNASTRDNGDPLLYIESIPYWETRGYVTTVLRNYWIYEGETGKKGSPSRAALAQGMWPRFPGMSGATAIRMGDTPRATMTASAD